MARGHNLRVLTDIDLTRDSIKHGHGYRELKESGEVIDNSVVLEESDLIYHAHVVTQVRKGENGKNIEVVINETPRGEQMSSKTRDPGRRR